MLLQFCYTKGISSDIIEKSGLFIFENGARDKFINRLMFPIFEPFGKITGFGGRALNESRVKYLNSPETAVFEKSKNLYAINFARKSKAGVFLLCEGYMDVIALHQAGFTGAVAALGTAFNKYHANLLKRYTKKCALIFDSDEAGTKAALRALPVLEEAGIAVSVLSLKGAKDPDEYIKTYGRDAFAEALSKAVSGVTFRIGCVKDKYDLNKPEDKTAFGTEAAGILAELPNVIEQSAYAKEIAKIADIPPEAVIAEIRKKTGGITAAPLALGRKKDGAGSIMAQKSLISILNGSVPAALAVKEHLPPGCLGNGIYAGLLSVIYENACNGKSLAPAELINTFEEYDAQKTAAEAFIDEPLPLSGGVLTGIVREILIDYYEKQADILGKSGDAAALNEILVKRRGVNQIRVESEGVLL